MATTSELPRSLTLEPQSSRGSVPILGPVLCLLAALLYTGANMALRRLAEPGEAANLPFALFVKEAITVLTVGPWLLVQLAQARIRMARMSHILQVVAISLPAQIVANLGMLWAFGKIGIAIAVPLSLATSLITATGVGRLWLKEAVSARLFVAIIFLILGVIILHGGANGLKQVHLDSSMTTLLAVALCCLAGFIYGILTVVIRNVTTSGTSGWFVLILVTGVGFVTLGPYNLLIHGPRVFLGPTAEQWLWMIVSGVFNLVAFWALTRGLSLTPVARANLLTSSQAAMATLAGWFVFGEPLNALVITGIFLTLVAILLTSLR